MLRINQIPQRPIAIGVDHVTRPPYNGNLTLFTGPRVAHGFGAIGASVDYWSACYNRNLWQIR